LYFSALVYVYGARLEVMQLLGGGGIKPPLSMS